MRGLSALITKAKGLGPSGIDNVLSLKTYPIPVILRA
jgi:hypothetical protein